MQPYRTRVHAGRSRVHRPALRMQVVANGAKLLPNGAHAFAIRVPTTPFQSKISKYEFTQASFGSTLSKSSPKLPKVSSAFSLSEVPCQTLSLLTPKCSFTFWHFPCPTSQFQSNLCRALFTLAPIQLLQALQIRAQVSSSPSLAGPAPNGLGRRFLDEALPLFLLSISLPWACAVFTKKLSWTPFPENRVPPWAPDFKDVHNSRPRALLLVTLFHVPAGHLHIHSRGKCLYITVAYLKHGSFFPYRITGVS